MQHHTVQFLNYKHDIEQRIDNFLQKHFKDVPKSHVYKILRTGQVRVNKKRVKPEYKLQFGDEVRVPPLVLKETRTQVETNDKVHSHHNKYRIDVLYQDQNYLIVNKPAGLAVHGGSGVKLGLIEMIRKQHGENVELIHRLDRGTSGCLLLALNRKALVSAHRLLREKSITKIYHALVEGYTRDNFIAKEALTRTLTADNARIVKIDPDGKPSVTKFTTITRGKASTLLCAQPISGRTHQIRVHLKQHGHAIIGDEKYEGRNANRLCLHAYQIDFECPITKKNILVYAEYDDLMIKILREHNIIAK